MDFMEHFRLAAEKFYKQGYRAKDIEKLKADTFMSDDDANDMYGILLELEGKVCEDDD